MGFNYNVADDRVEITGESNVTIYDIWDHIDNLSNADKPSGVSRNRNGYFDSSIRASSTDFTFYRLPVKLDIQNSTLNHEIEAELHIGHHNARYNEPNVIQNGANKGEIRLRNSTWNIFKETTVGSSTDAGSGVFFTFRPISFLPYSTKHIQQANQRLNNFRNAIVVRESSLLKWKNITVFLDGHVRASIQGGFDFENVKLSSVNDGDLPCEFRIENSAVVNIDGLVLERMPITIQPVHTENHTFQKFKNITILKVKYGIQSFCSNAQSTNPTTNERIRIPLTAPNGVDKAEYQTIFDKWENVDTQDCEIDVRAFRDSFNAVYNHAKGSAMTVGRTDSSTAIRPADGGPTGGSSGGAASRARLKVQFLDNTNTPIQYVKVRHVDKVRTQDNDDTLKPYTNPITYEEISDANGQCNFDILLGYLRIITDSTTAFTGYKVISRAVADDDDIYAFQVAAYEYLIDSIQQVNLRGLGDKSATKYLIRDDNILKSESTILSLAEINNNNDLYARFKSYLVENFKGESNPLVKLTGNVLDAQEVNLVFDGDAVEAFSFDDTNNSATIKASLYEGNITTVGSITLLNGATFIGTFNASNINTKNTRLTLTGLQANSEVRVFRSGTTTEVAGIENSDTDFTAIISDDEVDIVIHSLGFEYQKILGADTTSNLSLPVQQRVDRNYSNL